MTQCPVCGTTGEDLIFKFYCTNPTCQNYVPKVCCGNSKKIEIKDNEEEDECYYKYYLMVIMIVYKV